MFTIAALVLQIRYLVDRRTPKIGAVLKSKLALVYLGCVALLIGISVGSHSFLSLVSVHCPYSSSVAMVCLAIARKTGIFPYLYMELLSLGIYYITSSVLIIYFGLPVYDRIEQGNIQVLSFMLRPA